MSLSLTWGTERMLTDEVTHFGDACLFTGVTDADRVGWHGKRRELLTASAMAAILGQDPYNDAYDVFVEKTDPIPRPEPTIDDGGIFWGKVLEQPILTTVAKAYGWQYTPGGALLRSRRYPLFGCTLDAEIDRNDGRGWGVNEGKTTVLVGQWNEKEGELPSRVLIQGQHQLLVTDAPFCTVVALLAGSRKCIIELEPSPEFFAMIIDEGEAFNEELRAGNCPTPTHKSHVSERFPQDDGTTIKLPLEFVELTQSYFEKQKQIKALENDIEGIRNRVRDELGTASYGQLDSTVEGKSLWRWAIEGKGVSRVLRTMVDFPKGHAEHEVRRKKTLEGMTFHARVSPEETAIVAQRFRKGRQRTR